MGQTYHAVELRPRVNMPPVKQAEVGIRLTVTRQAGSASLLWQCQSLKGPIGEHPEEYLTRRCRVLEMPQEGTLLQ